MVETYLKDIKHEYSKNERICDWDFIEVSNPNVRVYYKPNEEVGLGFEFYAVESIEYDEDNWNIELCRVTCLFQGVAYYDGIRHLYMGDEFTDNFGYHFLPNLKSNIETLRVFLDLEKKYCRDCRG
jgi:hypothetical protein